MRTPVRTQAPTHRDARLEFVKGDGWFGVWGSFCRWSRFVRRPMCPYLKSVEKNLRYRYLYKLTCSPRNSLLPFIMKSTRIKVASMIKCWPSVQNHDRSRPNGQNILAGLLDCRNKEKEQTTRNKRNSHNTLSVSRCNKLWAERKCDLMKTKHGKTSDFQIGRFVLLRTTIHVLLLLFCFGHKYDERTVWTSFKVNQTRICFKVRKGENFNRQMYEFSEHPSHVLHKSRDF